MVHFPLTELPPGQRLQVTVNTCDSGIKTTTTSAANYSGRVPIGDFVGVADCAKSQIS